MKPKVSLIVSVCHKRVGLDVCLRSLRNQTWDDFEALVCDDCQNEKVACEHNRVVTDMGDLIHKLELTRYANWSEDDDGNDWLLVAKWLAAGATWRFADVITYLFNG